MKLLNCLNIKLYNIKYDNINNKRNIIYYLFIIFTSQFLLFGNNNGLLLFTNAKCFPMRGVSPNIIIDCDRDLVATFHYFNSPYRYSYETIEDDGHHFFYPHLFKSRLFDQSFNGGPIIEFEPEIKFFQDYIPIKGGEIFIRGNFLFDFEKNIKPLEIYYGDMSTFRMLNDTLVFPKYYGKDIYSIYIQPGCNAFIKVIDPNTNKILTETNYSDEGKCDRVDSILNKSYNHNQNNNHQNISNNQSNQNYNNQNGNNQIQNDPNNHSQNQQTQNYNQNQQTQNYDQSQNNNPTQNDLNNNHHQNSYNNNYNYHHQNDINTNHHNSINIHPNNINLQNKLNNKKTNILNNSKNNNIKKNTTNNLKNNNNNNLNDKRINK